MTEPRVRPLAMRADDEGELTIAVSVDPSGQVTIDFGKPIHWFSMSRQQAQQFALNILRKSADGYVKLEFPDDHVTKKSSQS
jgi:hypothetical protein